MRLIFYSILAYVFYVSCTSSTFEKTNREPDIVSQPATFEDYYRWDGKQWVWSEQQESKKPKPKNKNKQKWVEEDIMGKVFFGTPTIKSITCIPLLQCPPLQFHIY